MPRYLHIPHTPDTARTLTLTGFDCGDKRTLNSSFVKT